ncbi:hypothetical protein ABZ178_27365 [Streptomyces massasporeus]
MLVPFAGAGILTPAQVYPVVVGSHLGTVFITLPALVIVLVGEL